MDSLPILYQPLFELTQLGIPLQYIAFQTLTINENYICVRETGPVANVVIIDVDDPRQLDKKQIKAESANMNPTERTLGLKLGPTLQIYKLQLQPVKIGNCTMSDSIDFWKWLSTNMIGIVTTKAIYHWDLSKPEPTLICQRLSSLNGHMIVNYHVNHDFTWTCLVGITQEGQQIIGHMQLHSTEKNFSQPLEGHAATFSKSSNESTIFCFTSRNSSGAKLFIGEVSGSHRVSSAVYFPETSSTDFPVSIEVSDRYKVIYLITKEGFFHLYDLKSGQCITVNKISQETIFATCPQTSGGIVCVNQAGQVMAITINESTIIPYITNNLKDLNLAISLAIAANLPGAENILQTHFQQLISQRKYIEAAKVAAEAPGGILRTTNTVNLFKNIPTPLGGASPLLSYFLCLLERGSLSDYESLEFAHPLLQQNRKDLLEKWLSSDQLTCSETLGDLIYSTDPNIALRIYEKAGIKNKVVAILAESAQLDALLAYTKKENYQPDWLQIISGLITINPVTASNLVQKLTKTEYSNLLDINAVIELFLKHQLIREITAILLDYLSENRPQDAELQTRLLEITLKFAPTVADAIFEKKMFTHYDSRKISALAAQAGLTQRALQHTNDTNEIKRLLISMKNISSEHLIGICMNQTATNTLDILVELLRANLSENIDLVVSVAAYFTPQKPRTDSDCITPQRVISIMEEFNSSIGVYKYLKSIIPYYITNKNIVFKFIESAANIPSIKELETAVREYDYEPEIVRELLKRKNLPDQSPLIYLCDRFNFISDLTQYLYKNEMMPILEIYVEKFSPAKTPDVVEVLIRENCEDDKIIKLINIAGKSCPAHALIEVMDKNNKLTLLWPWLEARVAEGNTNTEIHNTAAKILILTNNKLCEQFLLTNNFYQHHVIGKFAESHDPNLALIIYKKGKNFSAIIDLTNRLNLFLQQARYVVFEQDTTLWDTVLSSGNKFRRNLINEIIGKVYLEIKRTEVILPMVKAFAKAELHRELMELLEKLLIEISESDFRNNKNLQNILISTTIKVDKQRVMEHILRLEAYDPVEIAEAAIGAGLLEEAFVIYKKFKLNVQAISVLIRMKNLERAYDFAESCSVAPDISEVYSKLGEAQLVSGLVTQSIESFLKAGDPRFSEQVITKAKQSDALEPLSQYLKMCRKKVRSERVDSELAYIYAKLNRNLDLEELLAVTNLVRSQEVGDKCFAENLFDSAKILYMSVNNFAKAALCLVKLGQFSVAIEAARKANSINIWKEINKACVDAGEFRYDKLCAMNVILHNEHLEELCRYYEVRGYSEQLITLLDSALGLDRAHKGIFTELGILYSKYRPEKLMEHIKFWRNSLYIDKIAQVCEKNRQWPEVLFLYEINSDNDKAARVMLQHPLETWSDSKFKEILLKISQTEIFYEAIKFYVEFHPELLNEFLISFTSRLDPSKVIERIRNMSHLPLIKRYLFTAQEKNLMLINEALHDLFIEEEDYESLNDSIRRFNNFDSIKLARKLEKNDLLEFRLIGANIYAQNKRWKNALDICKTNKDFKTAINIANQSGDREIVHDLLAYFVSLDNRHAFTATLFTCYNMIRPDYVLELAWQNHWTEYIYPYFIQYLHDYTNRMDEYTSKVNEYTAKVDTLLQTLKHSSTHHSSPSPTTSSNRTPLYGSSIGQMTYTSSPSVSPMSSSNILSGNTFGLGLSSGQSDGSRITASESGLLTSGISGIPYQIPTYDKITSNRSTVDL